MTTQVVRDARRHGARLRKLAGLIRDGRGAYALDLIALALEDASRTIELQAVAIAQWEANHHARTKAQCPCTVHPKGRAGGEGER